MRNPNGELDRVAPWIAVVVLAWTTYALTWRGEYLQASVNAVVASTTTVLVWRRQT